MSSKIAIYTEAEAHRQLCWQSMGPSNPDGVSEPRACKASRCMAWRWYVTSVPIGSAPTTAPPPHPVGVLEQRGDVYGYCGLAGDPEPRPASSDMGEFGHVRVGVR